MLKKSAAINDVKTSNGNRRFNSTENQFTKISHAYNIFHLWLIKTLSY